MRCNECNKFVPFDAETDPEFELDIDENGVVTGTVHIENNCAECGTAMTSADMDVEIQIDVPDEHIPTGDDAHDAEHELSVEYLSEERSERSEGRGRGRRQFYGVSFSLEVQCKCGWTAREDDCTVDVQSSTMEDIR